MRTAHEVSKLILGLSKPEYGDVISNLKLQKLLYYCQGVHLAMYDAPLFSEDLVAWEHGPVVPEVYRAYRDFGGSGIPIPSDLDVDVFTNEEFDLIEEVYMVFGQFSAWKLREMTHNESPWKTTPSNEVISKEAIKAYFKENVIL